MAACFLRQHKWGLHVSERKRNFEIPIRDLDLSVRTLNCLESVGIETVGDLVRQTEESLRAIWAFGDLCLFEVDRRLRQLGLHLGMDPEPK